VRSNPPDGFTGVGYLGIPSREQAPHLIKAFEEGLRSLGYRAGDNVAIEYRFASGELKRLAVVCTENLNPNVLTMKSAQYGARIYDAGSLNLARDRRIFVQ
jgi:hypothetical protein